MNGFGGGWLARLHPPARWHPATAIRARPSLPYPGTRSLLSRVTGRGKLLSSPENPTLEDGLRLLTPGKTAVQAPPDDTPYVPGPETPVKEMKDAEGRTYYISGFDLGYVSRHGRSVQGGHVQTAYTARTTWFNHSTKMLQYGKEKKRYVLILYNCNFVEDDEFWDENSVLLDFATQISEGGKDRRGHWPEADIRPVEFIYVQARFHYNASRPDEPWHITVDIGNRRTWNDGEGFFRKSYHIYAKNNDLRQGYAGYCSSATEEDTDPSQWDHNIDACRFTSWPKQWFRNPYYRKVLFEATQRSLEPPVASEFLKTKILKTNTWRDWIWRPISITGALEKAESIDSIPDQLNELLKSIRKGASKPASPAKIDTYCVVDHSGNRVHINEAVKKAMSEGKDVPPRWIRTLERLFANLTKKLKATSRLPVPLGAYRSARGKTARSPRTTRPPSRSQEQSPRPKGSDGSEVSSEQQLKSHIRSDEGLGIRQEHTGASEPGSRGRIEGQGGTEPTSESRARGSTVPQRPNKTRATTRASRTKLTIRDPSDKDAGIGHGDSASQPLASKAGDETQLVATPDSSQREARTRPRIPWRHPKATENLALGTGLLGAAPQLAGIPHQGEAPGARTPASEEASARPHTKEYQQPSSGKLLSKLDSPGSVRNGVSPSGFDSRNRRQGSRTRGAALAAEPFRFRYLERNVGVRLEKLKFSQDNRKPGSNIRSPLPPSAAELEGAKNTTSSYKARRLKQARPPNPSVWALPRVSEVGTPGEVHPCWWRSCTPGGGEGKFN